MFSQKKARCFLFLLFVAFFVTGCFPSSVQMENVPKDDLPGFWTALYHGGLAPISWIVSFFNKSVSVMATSNSGTGYLAGFAIGAMIAWLEPVAMIFTFLMGGRRR